MKKAALFLSMVLLLGLFTALPASAALSANPVSFGNGEDTLFPNVNAADVLINGGFEFGSDSSSVGWAISCNQAVDGVSQSFFGSANVSRSVSSHSGSYAMQLTNTQSDSASTCIRQTVSVTPGVTYELSAWAKTSLTTSGTIYIHGMFADPTGSSAPFSRLNMYYQSPSSQTALTADTWTRKGLRFTAPEGAVKLTLYLYLNGIGNVIWDDVAVLAPKEAVPPIAVDAKQSPVLSESSVELGPVYAITPTEGNFENYTAGHFIGKSDSPGAHNAMVSDAYNHTTGGGKSLLFKNRINAEHGNFLPNLYFSTRELIPGATYQLSTWILAPESGTNADFSYWINFTMSDGTTDQKKVHYTINHYGWWREITFNFKVPSDSGTVTTSVELRLMSDQMHYYLDDIALYMVEKPALADIQTDEMFYYSEWPEGICTATPHAAFNSTLAGRKVEYTFLEQDGTTVIDTEVVPYVDGKADYVFQTSWMGDLGKEYFISAKVYNASNTLLQEELLSVYRFNRPTYLGADGIFRKNNQEYNLVMGSGVTTELLEADPREGGVKIVRLVADGTSLQSRMDKAHEMGLLCLIGLYSNGISGGAESSIANTIEMVNTYKDHPALFGWKVQDEPYQKGNTDEEMERAYVTIRNLDPHHPVYLVDSVPGGYDWLFRYADIVDIDYYGGSNVDSGRIFTEMLDLAKAASKDRKPFTLLQQAFQYNGYLPTVEELRHFAYQAFFSGVSGIGYHSLGVDGSDGVTTPYMYMDEWDELCERWAPWEQGFLLDCFVNGEYTMLNSYKDNNVMWRTYQVEDKVYLIILNRNKSAETTASVPLTDANGNLLFTSYTATRKAGGMDVAASVAGSGTMTLTLGNLAAEIWEVTSATNLIPNGSFEDTFTAVTDYVRDANNVLHPVSIPVPATGWTAYKGGYSNTLDGTVSQVTSETIGEGEDAVTISPVIGEKFLKIDKNEGTISGSRLGVLYPLSNLLTVGQTYKFEAYVYLPDALATVTCGLVTDLNRGGLDTALNVGRVWTTSNTAATGGWVKVEKQFTYAASSKYLSLDVIGKATDGVAYFDGVGIYAVQTETAAE